MICDTIYCPWGIFLLLALFIIIVLIVVYRKQDVLISQSNTNNSPPPPPGPPPPRKPKLGELLLYGVLIVTFMMVAICIACRPQIVRIYLLYDTDYQNNEYIVGELKGRKLYVFDKLLMVEKKACGIRLPYERVEMVVDGDQDIIDAYKRWRICKDMRRSFHRIVYPDEREYFIDKYDLTWVKRVVVSTRYKFSFCKYFVKICSLFYKITPL